MFSVQLASNACDRLVSTGTLSLTNATLAATALDDRIPLGTQLVVAMAANITGTFAGLPEGGSFAAGSRRFVVSYAGNTNIVFTAVQPGMVLRVE